jgi:hypothetical protein
MQLVTEINTFQKQSQMNGTGEFPGELPDLLKEGKNLLILKKIFVPFCHERRNATSGKSVPAYQGTASVKYFPGP